MIAIGAKTLFYQVHQSSLQKLTNMNGELSASQPSAEYFIRSFCGVNTVGTPLSINGANGSIAIDIGFSDTAETGNEYCLADGNARNPLLSVVGYGRNTGTVGEIINNYLNVRNNGSSNVIVKEVGYYGNPTSGGSSDGSNSILFARKVLDTPVTIAPGETYNFTYVLKFKNT